MNPVFCFMWSPRYGVLVAEVIIGTSWPAGCATSSGFGFRV